MNDEDRQLWQNFSEALRRLLEHPDLSQAQRDFILNNLGDRQTDNVMEFQRERDRKR